MFMKVYEALILELGETFCTWKDIVFQFEVKFTFDGGILVFFTQKCLTSFRILSLNY